MNSMKLWQRLESAGGPVYVQSDKPDWLVPDAPTDHLLQQLQAGDFVDDVLARERLLGQLDAAPSSPYKGRAESLQLTGLNECWFHLTDNCNLACGHCLFGASPASTRSLPVAKLQKGLAEARSLGCTLFYFTGGEPFVYPDFIEVLKDLLRDQAVHAVVLTNGMLLSEHLAALRELPADRLHLQISMDGLQANHEQLRGSGTFSRLLDNLAALQTAGFAATLSVAVNRANVDELPAMVDFAAEHGVANIHLLWHFVRGKGSFKQFVEPALILPRLLEAQKVAEARGVVIDNVETLRSQVFSTPGTRFDLSNTGWESLAVGPDGMIYPSPALVGIDELNCGALADGLESVWRQSPVLTSIRNTSLIDAKAYGQNPLAFIIGGGDIDHSYLAGGEFVGHDPYLELYNGLALWLISDQASRYPDQQAGDILLRMGDVRHDCPESHEVALTHCNCVISLADDRGHSSVREFYGAAAVSANEEIANPFAPAQAEADFIPTEVKKKSYGCGSPVSDAALQKGEVLVDLGSGSGIECFMAAAEVGAEGKVYGIDMTDEMLHLARTSQAEVTAKLGYDNIEFRRGFLEEIPLADASADAVISNCVINLSPDKRQTFHEIQRILKPGGRLVVSDIVTDGPIPVRIKNDQRF
ncbi:MAG: methyltransferase domain-containing protein, partial [Desulfobulbaceae bacterium]|nr:methyltransferase domain-containing protein [Desulfobulbaceae bacterium]